MRMLTLIRGVDYDGCSGGRGGDWPWSALRLGRAGFEVEFTKMITVVLTLKCTVVITASMIINDDYCVDIKERTVEVTVVKVILITKNM